MNEWIIEFSDPEALDRIKSIGRHLHTEASTSVVVMKSDWGQTEIESISGVRICQQVDVFNLKSFGGAIIW